MSNRGASDGVGHDQVLLEALALGKDAAFEAVYEQFGAALLRTAASICASRTEAEDAVQEAFVGIVKLGTRVREVRNLRAYLFTAVVRAARRHPRDRDDAVRLDVDLPSAALATTEVPAEVPIGAERLERALQALPLVQREVISLHIDGGLTFEAIAEALGISVNTASSRYRYALEKLRAAMDVPKPASSREAASHG